MTIAHKLTLDLQGKGKMPHINVVQGDAFTRQVDLVLENGGKPWLFPICEPVVRYCKPDGTVGVYDTLPTGEPAFSYAGNMLTLALAPQMLTCPGVVLVQVEMNAQDLKLATFTFLVVVKPGVALCGGSEDYVNWTKAFLPQTTGAKVGQFLQISKVDDAGRITEMAPAENPAGEATNKAYEALRIANDVAQEMQAYSPSGTRSIAEAAMRTASERLVAPQSASVGQYFRVAAVDANGMVTEVEAVDAPSGGDGSGAVQNPTNADVSGIKTVLGNIMTIIKAQTDSEGGVERPQGYNMDVSGLVVQNDALIAALGCSGDSGGDTTEKTLTSISAAYSGGSVTAGTAVNDLTGIVVTAHYSDGTSEAVVGYTLSGTIAEGSNTITVSYGGKITTFAVTGVAESSGGDTVTVPFSSLEQTVGIMQTSGTATTTSIARHVQFPYVEGMVVSCYLNDAWLTNGFSPVIVNDNGTYTALNGDKVGGSGTLGQYVVTLSGYSENAIVYANFNAAGADANCYYSYEEG